MKSSKRKAKQQSRREPIVPPNERTDLTKFTSRGKTGSNTSNKSLSIGGPAST